MPRETTEAYGYSTLSILDEDGHVDEALEPDLSRDELIRMYRAMVLARESDQRMLKLQRQGRIGTFGPCTGHEACSVGSTSALDDRDWFVPAFRELGGRLLRGEPLVNPFLFYNGYEEGNLLPEDVPFTMTPTNIIVGSQTLHAVGVAYAQMLRKTGGATLVSFGDGATSQGDVHEAMNFAAVWRAPVVFFCQNNQWAISHPRSQQTRARSIAQKAIAYEMPGIQVDGNDVLAVYVATREALDRARAGDGPTLIEGLTYRLMMHTTADDPTRYRTDDEVERAWQREPLIRFRKYLEAKRFWDEDAQGGLDAEIKADVDAAVAEFEAEREVDVTAPFDHVFGTTHAVIEEQRQEFLAVTQVEQLREFPASTQVEQLRESPAPTTEEAGRG